jgi:hypothetical protein
MIDDVIFCRRPLSQLDGHMSSGAYHKLENLRALKESEVKRTLIDLLIEEVDEKNYIAHGLIENKGRGRVTTIKYIISFSFIRGMVWIIDDIEIL